MNKLDFHAFFEYIWEDDVIEIIVSTKYLEEHDEFIKQLTLDLYRQYEFSNDVSPAKYKKMIEIMFSNLFAFKPKTSNIKEIKDNYRDIIGNG